MRLLHDSRTLLTPSYNRCGRSSSRQAQTSFEALPLLHVSSYVNARGHHALRPCSSTLQSVKCLHQLRVAFLNFLGPTSHPTLTLVSLTKCAIASRSGKAKRHHSGRKIEEAVGVTIMWGHLDSTILDHTAVLRCQNPPEECSDASGGGWKTSRGVRDDYISSASRTTILLRDLPMGHLGVFAALEELVDHTGIQIARL